MIVDWRELDTFTFLLFLPNTMFFFTFSCCIIYLNFNLKLRVELLLALRYWLLDWKNKETTHTLTLLQSWNIFFCCLDDSYKHIQVQTTRVHKNSHLDHWWAHREHMMKLLLLTENTSTTTTTTSQSKMSSEGDFKKFHLFHIFGVRDHLMHQHNSDKFDHCLYYLGYLWHFRES